MPMITSIQKYSIHDGAGIRTTIFFKGCPLKCVWCHNPETQNYGRQVMQDKEKCVGCKACEKVCPNHAIFEKDNKAETDRESCNNCGVCTDYCNLNLREIMGHEYTVKELVDEVKKDLMFYEESGGGVTLSGGEVMTMDIDYIEGLVKMLYKQGISVNIDTCGQTAYHNFKRILPYVDTILYDIKSMNSEQHKEYTGLDNTVILYNLINLNKDGAKLNIRIPTIAQVNGNQASMKEIIDFLLDHHINVEQVNLLPYHNIGAGKYEKLGTTYEGTKLQAPSNDEMKQFLQMFKDAGFQNTKIGG